MGSEQTKVLWVFSGVSSIFSAVLAGNEREALLRAADQLSSELGYSEGEEPPGADSRLGGESRATDAVLNSEDEALVSGMRRGLARIAAALVSHSDDGSGNRVGAALDGAEMVMRGELLFGNADRLPALMPSFVFLIALQLVDQDRALELSRRTTAIVAVALDS